MIVTRMYNCIYVGTVLLQLSHFPPYFQPVPAKKMILIHFLFYLFKCCVPILHSSFRSCTFCGKMSQHITQPRFPKSNIYRTRIPSTSSNGADDADDGIRFRCEGASHWGRVCLAISRQTAASRRVNRVLCKNA